MSQAPIGQCISTITATRRMRERYLPYAESHTGSILMSLEYLLSKPYCKNVTSSQYSHKFFVNWNALTCLQPWILHCAQQSRRTWSELLGLELPQKNLNYSEKCLQSEVLLFLMQQPLIFIRLTGLNHQLFSPPLFKNRIRCRR